MKEKSLDNKEGATYIAAKERKSTENHNRGTEHLQNMVKQKENRVN
jgi:hypothetical protein